MKVVVEYDAQRGYWYVDEARSWRNLWFGGRFIALSSRSEADALEKAGVVMAFRRRSYRRTTTIPWAS